MIMMTTMMISLSKSKFALATNAVSTHQRYNDSLTGYVVAVGVYRFQRPVDVDGRDVTSAGSPTITRPPDCLRHRPRVEYQCAVVESSPCISGGVRTADNCSTTNGAKWFYVYRERHAGVRPLNSHDFFLDQLADGLSV